MTLKEFKTRTNLSTKTARRIHDLLHPGCRNDTLNHRHFTEEDVEWVLDHQLERFKKNHPDIRIKHIKGSTCYITDSGDVYNYRYNYLELRKIDIKPCGYRYASITIDGIRKGHRVCRLVAKAFVKNPEDKPQVNHIDGCKTNDHYTNLEWVTASENMKHAVSMGLVIPPCDVGIGVDMYNYDTDILIVTYGSIREAHRETGCEVSTIARGCRRNRKPKTCKAVLLDDGTRVYFMKSNGV